MLIYDFDILGIVYTSVVGALALALLAVGVVFIARKRPSGKSTVVFRVLDILLIVLLCVVWFVFIAMKVSVFGLFVGMNGENGLGFFVGGADASMSDPATLLFEIPMLGGLTLIWSSVLGIVLLGLLTVFAAVDLVLAFALRRKNKDKKKAEKVAAPSAEEQLPAEGQNMLFERFADMRKEENGETSVAAETEGEKPDAPSSVAVAVNAEEPASEAEAPAVAAVAKAEKQEETEKRDEPVRTEKTISPDAPPRPAVLRETSASPRPAVRQPSVAARRPVAAKRMPVEDTRPASVNPRGFSKPTERTAQTSSKPSAVVAPQASSKKLPVTRKVVIMNRMNVVNMFNEYLEDKNQSERDKLSDRIHKIILK